jgi:hypothetical protein
MNVTIKITINGKKSSIIRKKSCGSTLVYNQVSKKRKTTENKGMMQTLSYKQRVTGSTPVAPTGNQALRKVKLLGAFLFDT